MAKLMHKLFGIVALSSLAAVPFVMGAGQSGEAASRGAKFSEFVKPTAENGANAQLRPFAVGAGAFDPKGGRIQVFDKDLNILGTAFANCNQGFDILPAPMRGDGRMFVRAKTQTGETGVSCSFYFIDLDKEKTCQAK